MGAVSSVAVAPVIEESDVAAGITEIQCLDTVQRWVKRGMPTDDIEMEVPNVINRATGRPNYQAMRDRLCDKYQIDEPMLVRMLLRQIATS